MIKYLFQPKSIVIIGASNNTKSLGYSIWQNIIQTKYKGKIFLVNPKYKKIGTKRSYSSVLKIKARLDLAILVIPAAVVLPVLIECGKKKIKAAIVISAGFSEIGEAGRLLEDKLKEIANKYKINLLGPNCLGILDSYNNLNASFAQSMIDKGKAAFISQSGAICTAVLDWAQNNNLGFSKFISLGNKAVLNEVDFLKFLQKDNNSKIILAYLEGIKQGEDFIKIVKQITFKKPIIIIKPGSSEQAKKAISSHTGTMAGDSNVFSAVVLKTNLITADSLEDFFNLINLFCRQPELTGNQIAIITNAGGPGVITTDLIEKSQLNLAKFSQKTKNYLTTILPPTANVNNPIDIVGDADARRYKIAINAALEDKNVDGVIVILTPQAVTEIAKTSKVIVKASRGSKKPIVTVYIGGKKVRTGFNILSKGNIPIFNYSQQAVTALEKMAIYTSHKKISISSNKYKKICPDLKKYNELKLILKEYKNNLLDFRTTENLLKIYEINLVDSYLLKEKSEISTFDIDYPVIAKVSSPQILHRSDLGGVVTKINNDQDLANAYDLIINNIKKNSPQAEIEGIIIQPIIKGGVEVILGGKRDSQFGPVIMFGMGGIYTEIFKDVQIRLAPLSLAECQQMIQTTKIYQILKGARGKSSYDIDDLALTINKLSQLMIDFDGIKEIDINPAFVQEKGKGLVAVDFKIIVN